MISAEEQKQVLFLVRQTKDLILKEMKNEEVMVKGAANYVTNVDLAVQNFLNEELGKAFPDIALIAEEKENTGLSEEGTYWILDPIDGTANLILDFRMSAVALGLYEKGEIVFGAVFNPFTDELFHAAEQLNQESASLRQNQRVNAYLDAELALCRLMQRICRTLVAGIDIQIPDL